MGASQLFLDYKPKIDKITDIYMASGQGKQA